MGRPIISYFLFFLVIFFSPQYIIAEEIVSIKIAYTSDMAGHILPCQH